MIITEHFVDKRFILINRSFLMKAKSRLVTTIFIIALVTVSVYFARQQHEENIQKKQTMAFLGVVEDGK